MEVFTQRLEQEFDALPIVTAPSVTYKLKLKPTKQNIKEASDVLYVNNPAHFPDHVKILETYEPMVKGIKDYFLKQISVQRFFLGTILTPDKYLGSIISLCLERRGVQLSATNIDNERLMLIYDLPLNEVVIDFHDSLKTISSGYASFDYEDIGYELSSLVKVRF